MERIRPNGAVQQFSLTRILSAPPLQTQTKVGEDSVAVHIRQFALVLTLAVGEVQRRIREQRPLSRKLGALPLTNGRVAAARAAPEGC